MTKKNSYVVVAIALCAIMAAGGILASNMGFKLNYPLQKLGTAASKSGTNTIGLPYFRQTGLNDSFQLIQDMEGTPGPTFTKVTSVAKFIKSTDGLLTYSGRMGAAANLFSLTSGEGYRVQVSADINYIVVGSHDPSLAYSLDSLGAGSKSGTNDYAPPYNTTSLTAFDLIKDIEGTPGPTFTKVTSVAKFIKSTDGLLTYSGRMGAAANLFSLVPGESYRIQMSATVPYIASHY